MLKLDFTLDEKAAATLQKAGRETTVSVVVLVMKNETITQLGDPIAASGNISNDLQKARSALEAAKLETAYVVVYAGQSSPVTVIVYTSDNAKPKERMLYSSGSAHLIDCVSKGNVLRKTKVDGVQAATVDEIQPTLFKHKEDTAGRKALMTETERFNEEVAKMPVAPQPTRLPGVSVAVSNETSKLLQQLASGSSSQMVVTFKIEESEVRVDRQRNATNSGKNEQLAVAKSLVPSGEPRFVLTSYRKPSDTATAMVMVYVCPESCQPKLKMTYASSKASFLEQLAKNGISVSRNVETSSGDELPAAVEDAFVEIKYDDAEKKPAASKPPGARGQRMLI